MDFKEFGSTLATLRKKQNISQSTLANDIGISRATISSLENGRGVDIGLKKVLKILDYLGYELAFEEKSQFPSFEELRDGK
ncbi:MAG: transcriptional regulator [Sulfurimonas sp.]|nr:MAG: transcriptional regulator [Sulfurimonas sp.]